MLLKLSGKWTLSDGNTTIDSTVPGDITNDCINAGIINNPYVGYEYRNSDWVTRGDWKYEREFLIDSLPEEDAYTYIRFKGVDTISSVYLNDIKIGETNNMHLEYKFECANALRVGKNVLKVEMKSVFSIIDGEKQTKYGSIFEENRILIRKAQCHFGWDWAPKFPGYGIYRDVSLESVSRHSIDFVNIQANINGEAQFRIKLLNKFEGNLTIGIKKDGKILASKTASVNEKKILSILTVDNPKLWYPNGYGSQELYEYFIILKKNDETIDERSGRFAFRKVELVQERNGENGLSFGFRINGKDVYARGSNWVPSDLMTGTISDDRYRSLLKSARDANMNMLRIWGGGIYESDLFYDLCDEYGIMIWQDFMFACSEIQDDDPEFIGNITEEAIYQVRRLRNHPCLTYFCGENEITGAFNENEERYSIFTLHYLLRGIVKEIAPDIPYERTSPFSFADIENDDREGDSHNNVSEVMLFDESFKGFDDFEYKEVSVNDILKERIRNYDRFLSKTKNNFSSECAVIGMSNYESIEKYTPPEKRTLDPEFFYDRFLGNPYAPVMPNFYERQTAIADAMFGPSDNLMDLSKKTNRSQAEIMKSEITYARVNGKSRGFLNWMYNDIWPTGTWSVIDYYLTKKPCYYEMKRSYSPLISNIIKLDGKYVIAIVNDTERKVVEDAVISYRNYDGSLVDERKYQVVSDPSSKILIELDDIDCDYIESVFAGFEDVCDKGKFDGPKYNPEFSYMLENDELVIKTKTFVPFVQIHTNNESEATENYMDLAAGKTYRIRLEGNVIEKEITVKPFTEIWNK